MAEYEYEIIRSSRRTISAEIKRNKLIVRAPRRASNAEIERFLARNGSWIAKNMAKAQAREEERSRVRRLTRDEIRELKEKASVVIPERAAHYAALMGVTYGRITIRAQKTRWGSCSSKGNLSFNCLLMLAPPEVLDSVVVHELCHLRVMNHSERFYAEVLRVFPEYREKHGWLKDNGDMLLAMLDD